MVQTVTVKDKEGRPIEGLASKDFIVSEDGEPQTVSFVEFQRLPDRPVEPAAPTPSATAPPAATVAPATQGQISTPPPGDTRYRDRRLLVLSVDAEDREVGALEFASGGRFGWVSGQLDPRLFTEKEAMYRQADELAALEPNVMVKVPASMEDLVRLRGVGRKTANVVLGVAFGVPGFAVDTHVTRLTRRLRLTVATDPVKIEQAVCSVVPAAEWTDLGLRLILHGRRVCVARKPRCPMHARRISRS